MAGKILEYKMLQHLREQMAGLYLGRIFHKFLNFSCLQRARLSYSSAKTSCLYNIENTWKFCRMRDWL